MGNHHSLLTPNSYPGQNDVGMIAWLMTLFVPEAPEGRDIIVISNDITFDIGTFGPGEDKLYMKASEMARKRGIPRIYISGEIPLTFTSIFDVNILVYIVWKALEVTPPLQ